MGGAELVTIDLTDDERTLLVLRDNAIRPLP